MYTAAKSEDKRDNVTKKMKTSDVMVRDMNLPFCARLAPLQSYLAHRYFIVKAFYEPHQIWVTVTFYSD